MQNSEPAHLAAEGVGYLDMRDYNKARWAFEYSRKFLPWLRIAGYVSFTDVDVRVDSSSDGHIGIPATKLAYLEITRLMQELNQWREVEDAAGDDWGAELLKDLGREMSTAVHRWPMEEKPHKITDMRCGGCGMLTLMYRPPRWEEDEIKADCSQRCGFELVGDDLMKSVKLLEMEEIERRKAS